MEVEMAAHEFDDTSAMTVTVPEAPILHCAIPPWLIIAMVGSEINQDPE
jgi:hypothetical protein